MIEQVVNRVLRLDPETLRRLGELTGKTVRLDLGAGEGALTFFVSPSADGLRFHRRHEGVADVTLRGTIPLFARLLRTGIAVGELQISGDIELGSRFKRILEDVELDFEEPLSRLVGDVAAHEIGRGARDFVAWGKRAADSFARDIAEYLQEESRVLASRTRVDAFLRAVDTLRADADRLQQRLDRLKR